MSRFSKGRWKDDIVKYMGESFTYGSMLPILRGDLRKCKCECEMIKDIILPERFNKMMDLAKKSLF